MDDDDIDRTLDGIQAQTHATISSAAQEQCGALLESALSLTGTFTCTKPKDHTGFHHDQGSDFGWVNDG